MRKGRFAWIAEALCAILLFLLPLKFGTLVAVPNMTMIYWADPYSLIIAAWPFPVFPVFAAVFLICSLIFIPGEIFPGKAGKFSALWLLLTLAALPGGIAKGTPPDAFCYFMDHLFSMGAYLLGFCRVVNHNRKMIDICHGAFTASFLFSLVIGLNQYFSGYQETIEQISAQNMDQMNFNILRRLKEMRVSGGFSACNAFAGYLVMGLPVALAWLWKIGKYVSPPMVSRILFTVPVGLAGLFLLVKTGSRGGILSLLAAGFLLFLASDMPKKWRWGLFSLIPIGIAGMTALVMLGRGGKSILFRLDYFQGAFRMMLESPLYGTGWGGFQRHFMKMKWIYDAEAPASPHNFPLSIGSQSGVFGFLIACVILAVPMYYLFRFLMKSPLRENLRDDRIMISAAFAAVSGFTVHSLQDVLFESPGAIISYGAVAILAFFMMESGKTPEPGLESRKKVLRILLYIFLFGYAGGALYFGRTVLVFDHSLATLNDMTDIRMIPREEYGNINPAEVQSMFEATVKKNPASPYPYLTLSDFFMVRGDIAASRMLTYKALELDPESSALYVRLYRIYLREGDKEKAIRYLNRAIELFPMNPNYKNMLNE